MLKIRTLPGKPEELNQSSKLVQIFFERLIGFRFLPSARQYNLTISHEKKFVWFRVAKVGTRTILNHFKANSVHLDAEHPYEVRYSPALYGDYFKFGFVRNPWARLVSCWLNKVVASKTRLLSGVSEVEHENLRKFENFVDYVATFDLTTCDIHLRSQWALIDLGNVDYVGRMETFAADFQCICGTLGIPCEKIVPKNVTQKSFYHDYYTDATRDKVREIYRKDIQILGYEF